MTVAAFAFLIVCVLASAGWLTWMLRHPIADEAVPDVIAARERRQWVITLKSGSAFRGVLTDHDAACLVLTDAEHLADAVSPVPVDGEVVLLLAEVKYAQRL